MNRFENKPAPQQVVIAFLSSTSRDLTEHRAQVREHCERFGYHFRMMEEFGAQDSAADQVSVAEINGCRLFVGLYARRYGFVPAGSDESITELEYHEAERAGLPRLLFVVAPDFSGHPLIEAYRDDGDPIQRDKLRRFLDHLAALHVWDTFTTPAHLANRVAFAISKWEGWRPARPSATRYRYVGREDLLHRLETALVRGQRTALTGIGGIGKTLTAATVALRAAADYPGGVLWVGLGTEARDSEQVLQATMRAWAERHHPGRLADPGNLTTEIVRRWIADAPQRVLVVLDDIWHAQVGRELLRLVPDGTGLLVTTRRSDVARQMGLEPFSIDRLAEEEAIALLRDRVGDLPSWKCLRRIAQLLEGHPLALEIVAAQIVSGSPDLAEGLPGVIADRLRDPGEGLIGLMADLSAPLEGADTDPSRYSSLSVALGLTYETFPEDLKRRFRETGVLAPDAFLSEPLLAAVWADDLAISAAAQEFASRTAALVSSGVLAREGAVFTRHALIRLYALWAARKAGDERAASDRYVDYVLEHILPRLGAVSPERWDIELGDELPHVHFVGNLLANASTKDDRNPRMIRFAAAVERYLEYRREVPGGPWLEAAAIACARERDPIGQARFLNALAGFHYARRDARSGLKAAHEAARLAGESGDRAGQARAAFYFGYHYLQADPYEARSHFEMSADLCTELGDTVGRIDALIQLARCDGDMYNPPNLRRRGGDRLDEALRLALTTNARLREVRALIARGNLHQTYAESQAAHECFQRALQAARSIGSQGDEATALLGLAGSLAELDDLGGSAHALVESAELFELVADRVGQATALRNAAQVATLRGDPSRAAQLYATALPFVRKRTLQEVDRFQRDDMRAIPVLTVRLEDVLFDDHREQYRAKLYEQPAFLEGIGEAESQWPQSQLMPEDVLGFLVRQTIAAAVTDDRSSAAEWGRALADFARRLDTAGPLWKVDAAFARALAEVAAGGDGKLPEGHTYHGHIGLVQERVDQRRKGVPVYGAKQLQYLLSNTRAVRTEEKDKINEWSERLRQLRHEATVWGDSDEAELLNALLALAKDRLASVGPDNRYAHPYHQLQQHLGAREESLLEWIERKSLEVSCEVPQLLRDWRRKLAECAELAVLWRQHREEEFYRGLLELLGGQSASLPEGHVYARSLAYVAAARAAGLRPPAIATRDVRLMFSTVRDGGPSEPERRDSVRTKLSKLLAEARSDGDRDELEFFEALLAMLEGGRREMSPKNGYRIYLESRMGERL